MIRTIINIGLDNTSNATIPTSTLKSITLSVFTFFLSAPTLSPIFWTGGFFRLSSVLARTPLFLVSFIAFID